MSSRSNRGASWSLETHMVDETERAEAEAALALEAEATETDETEAALEKE